MTYQATLDYLFSQLPMYQRQGKAAYKANLDNTLALMAILKHPYKEFKSVHIGGTNGKGSTSHMLSSILQETGYKVGLYTSPHLLDFRERIKINGQEIPEEDVIEFVELFKKQFENLNLSFFEWTVGLAFSYFAKEKVDIAIIEVGMGGRLDSTNVINPVLSVITNISLDHTQFLGTTLSQIAQEKAGIIKSNTRIVIGESNVETKTVFQSKANELKAPILFSEDLHFETIYPCDLLGSYQVKNQKTVLSCIPTLQENHFIISQENIEFGFRNTSKNTGLLGRWQTLSTSPLTICDTAHNQSGLEDVLGQIKNLGFKKVHFILGMVNDKDVSEILQLFPKNEDYYFCKANIPRALDSKELKSIAEKAGIIGEDCGSVENAINSAKKRVKKEELLYIGGSTFVVADVLRLYPAST
jgi:dihydrofolate synthase/folylpolyglutamate synthase